MCCCIYPSIKVLFCLWLYYPEYKGALLLDQIFGEYIDKGYLMSKSICGKVFELTGIKDRDIEGFQKNQVKII